MAGLIAASRFVIESVIPPSPSPARSRLENRARQIAFKSTNDRAITNFRSKPPLSRPWFFFFSIHKRGRYATKKRVLGELETPRTYISYTRVFSRAFFPFSLFPFFFLFLFSLFQIARRLKINWHPGARSG